MNADVSGLKIGSLTLEKGLIRRDVKMFAWDGIQDCTGGVFEVDLNNPNPPVVCPVNHLCTYIKRGKCAVQVKYLESLYSSVLGTYSYLDEAMLFKIGMQIIPLYVQLVKLQIVELSLHSPVYTSEKGAILVHPIYKEIRETMKTIHVMWKDLDLAFNFNKKPKLEDEEKEFERSDPAFYKKLIGDNTSQKGVIR
jgi:hypothetical protein